MLELVIYIHGKGGIADEAEHYMALFPEAEVLGFDYQSRTPWEAEAEFQAYYDKAAAGHGPVYREPRRPAPAFCHEGAGDGE